MNGHRDRVGSSLCGIPRDPNPKRERGTQTGYHAVSLAHASGCEFLKASLGFLLLNTLRLVRFVIIAQQKNRLMGPHQAVLRAKDGDKSLILLVTQVLCGNRSAFEVVLPAGWRRTAF